MMTTDRDMLARHLIDVWGDYVKVDDMPDDLIIPFAIQTLRQAAAKLAALQAVADAVKPIKKTADWFKINRPMYNDDAPVTLDLTVGDMRRISDALKRIVK